LSDLKWITLALLLIFLTLPLSFLLIFRKLIKPGVIADQELKHLNIVLDNKVNERTNELRESEEYNKSLFENSRIPLVVMDCESYRFIDCNDAAASIYGFKNKGDVLEKTPLDVSFATQYNGVPSAKIAVNFINQAIAEETVIFEWKHQRPSGEVWDGEVQLMPITIKDKTYLLFSLLDITERKKLESERKFLDEQLAHSQKMDAIGQLAGGVAHDFNNVLSGIMGAAQLLTNPSRHLDKKGLGFVDMILNASSRATDLTQKLLMFAHKGNSIAAPVSVHSVVEETLDFLKISLDKRVKIETELTAKEDIVVVDSSELQNSLMNLCINASHAMPDGGCINIAVCNIELDSHYCEVSPFYLQPGMFVQIDVTDHGVGIDPTYIERIFDPFFTTKGQGEGTGLGLSSVYGTIQRYHGAITVKSHPGKGSIFTIYLPCSKEILTNSNPDGVDLNDKLSNGSILFVDDEEIIRISGQGLLEEMGYEVHLAEDGEEAIEVFRDRHHEIDIVVMDMIMPNMSGREALPNERD